MLSYLELLHSSQSPLRLDTGTCPRGLPGQRACETQSLGTNLVDKGSFFVQVDAARKYLNFFWKGVRDHYYECKLIADGGDFFSPKKKWLRQGNEYRELVEPLDIANWYKANIHLKGSSGHYFGKATLKEVSESFSKRLTQNKVDLKRQCP